MRSDDRLVLTCVAIVMGGGILATCLLVVGSVGLIGWSGFVLQETAQIYQTEIAETEQAFQAEIDNAELLLEEAEDWEILISDPFDSNKNDWLDGAVDFERLEGEVHLTEGRYYWQLEAKDGFVYYAYPDMEVLGDFYLEVETEQLSGPITAEQGLVFRRGSNEYYYYFAITEDQRYRVSYRRAGEWVRVIPTTFSDIIQPGQPNRLTVIAIHEEVYFYINGAFVNFIDDSQLTRGKAGVLTGLSLEGDTVEFAFDNFEVRIPPEDE